jgi:UDP-2,3-diacylglucosamine hydrolase
MYTLFISDIHLSASTTKLNTLFFTLLHACQQDIDALYILGDLFEYWIGDDSDDPIAKQVCHSLLQLSQTGVAIFLMAGNRDFLLGADFAKQSGCQPLVDPAIITVYGKSILLSHGDLFTQNQPYLRYRRLVHQTWLQRLFLSLPLSARHALAHWLRGRSQQQPSWCIDADGDTVQGFLQRYQQDFCIHGHTHYPCISYCQPQALAAYQRIGLSDWGADANGLLIRRDGQYRLRNFSLAELNQAHPFRLTKNTWPADH